MPESPKGGWKGWVAGPWAIRARRGDLNRNSRPAKSQGKVLATLLEKAQDTAFGRDHGLSDVLAIQDPKAREAAFRAAVPVRDYEGLKPYVDRMVDG